MTRFSFTAMCAAGALSLLLCPVAASAQAAVLLCMPEASAEMREALTVELRARGHEVRAECPGENDSSWVLSLEVQDALADVWVHARGPAGEERARVGGPLDTLDARAFALTAASLIDEPVPPPPADTAAPMPSDGEEASATATPIVSPQAQLTAPAPPEPSTSTRTGAPEEPVELVESSRMLRLAVMIELGLLAGLISHEQWALGGRAGFGAHLAPWVRLRIPFTVSFTSGRTFDMTTGCGLDVVISLSRGESWLELGLAARFAARSEGPRLVYAVGPGANVGFFYAFSESWRFFVRAEGMALFDLESSDAPGYGLYLSLGTAVFL